MTRILAISPHLDDAVFSAGGTLAEAAAAGAQVTVLTCFTGNVECPTGFALACQLDKGLSPDIDYMALRRAEDERACAAIGADAVHLPFLEAPHRGYENATALFEDRLPGDDIVAPLAEAMCAAIAEHRPDIIYAPYGVGRHVDHIAVRDALLAAEPNAPVTWWEDYPYAMREVRTPGGITRTALKEEAAQAKLAAVLAYESQLGFQFGGVARARETLSAWKQEGFAPHPIAD